MLSSFVGRLSLLTKSPSYRHYVPSRLVFDTMLHNAFRNLVQSFKQDRESTKVKSRMTGSKDPEFRDARRGVDIIIPVMGPTGAGKSTFINSIAGWDAAEVGTAMESKTKTLEAIIIDVKARKLDLPLLKGKRLILLDTPGFDDTAGHEAIILRRIAVWLALSYKSEDHHLGGIIHLHDITQTRMTPSLKRSLEVFSCLCGDSAYPRIALGTTKWPSIASPDESQAMGAAITHDSPRDQAETRFNLLENKYWKELIGLGSKTYRIENGDCALQLVRSILETLESTTEDGELELQLQKEVVDEGKTVPETKAGKIVETEYRNRKNQPANMTKDERAAEDFIHRQLKEMDRQLAELATNKNPSSRPFKWLNKVLGSQKR